MRLIITIIVALLSIDIYLLLKGGGILLGQQYHCIL